MMRYQQLYKIHLFNEATTKTLIPCGKKIRIWAFFSPILLEHFTAAYGSNLLIDLMLDGKSIPKHIQWFLEGASFEIVGLKHEYMKAGPALAHGVPHCVGTAVTSAATKGKTHLSPRSHSKQTLLFAINF